MSHYQERSWLANGSPVSLYISLCAQADGVETVLHLDNTNIPRTSKRTWVCCHRVPLHVQSSKAITRSGRYWIAVVYAVNWFLPCSVHVCVRLLGGAREGRRCASTTPRHSLTPRYKHTPVLGLSLSLSPFCLTCTYYSTLLFIGHSFLPTCPLLLDPRLTPRHSLPKPAS